MKTRKKLRKVVMRRCYTHTLHRLIIVYLSQVWDKVFKSGLSKFCGRQPLKNLKESDPLKQTIFLEIF